MTRSPDPSFLECSLAFRDALRRVMQANDAIADGDLEYAIELLGDLEDDLARAAHVADGWA